MGFVVGDSPEDRQEQRLSMKAMRAERAARGAAVFAAWIARQAMPIRYSALILAWRSVASVQLVSRRHMGRGGGPLGGFGERWVMAQIARLGFSVTGSKRVETRPVMTVRRMADGTMGQVPARTAMGAKITERVTVDDRTVDNPNVI